jgi:hypothetical protein
LCQRIFTSAKTTPTLSALPDRHGLSLGGGFFDHPTLGSDVIPTERSVGCVDFSLFGEIFLLPFRISNCVSCELDQITQSGTEGRLSSGWSVVLSDQANVSLNLALQFAYRTFPRSWD